MGKYFGTDGFRGEANKNLNFEHAIQIGRFLGCLRLPARMLISCMLRRLRRFLISRVWMILTAAS